MRLLAVLTVVWCVPIMGHDTVVETLFGPECQSLLEKNCATDTGEACEQCADAHGLHMHGCSENQIESFCNGAESSSCDKEFNEVCPPSARKDENLCLECARSHRHDLEKAGCTPAHIEHVCSGAGPSPGPGPSPTPPGPGPSPGSDLLTKVLFDNSDPSAVGGRCLDGSPAGYHYGEAKPEAANKWVIFVKGGGACGTEKTCTEFSKSLKGSSKHWGPTIDGDNVYSGDPNVNPDFYTWNRVRVAYCTGDCHSGQRTAPSADTWNFWFDGHLNFQRVITDLKEKYGLDNATHVLMSGNSAGGLGTFINVDYLAAQLPSAKVFKAAPQAGWFFPEDPAATPKGSGLPLNFTAKEITHSSSSVDHSVTGSLYQGYVNPACLAAYPKAEQQFCGSVHNLYRYIATPLLVIENQYDTNQIYSSAGGAPKHPEGKEIQEKADYIAYYGGLMRDSIAQQVKGHGQTKAKGKDGLFLPSCLSHGMSTETTIAVPSFDNNTSTATNSTRVGFMELLGDWYFERNQLPSHILIDDCNMTDGQPCNPNCPNP